MSRPISVAVTFTASSASCFRAADERAQPDFRLREHQRQWRPQLMGRVGNQAVASLHLSLDGLDRGIECIDQRPDLGLDVPPLEAAQ